MEFKKVEIVEIEEINTVFNAPRYPKLKLTLELYVADQRAKSIKKLLSLVRNSGSFDFILKERTDASE